MKRLAWQCMHELRCGHQAARTASQSAQSFGLGSYASTLGPSCAEYQQNASLRWFGTDTASKAKSLEEIEKACWSCNNHLRRGTFACQGCEKIQPVDASLNFFELMGMPNQAFDLDLQKLERQYKLLQWSLHPDKVVLKTREEQHFAAQQATLINQAYSILRDPLSRANYILSLRGVQSGESFEGTISDKEFLMEVLELQETVEQCEDVETLKKLLAENKAQEKEVIAGLSEALKGKNDTEAVEYVTRLTYLYRLAHDIIAKLPPG